MNALKKIAYGLFTLIAVIAITPLVLPYQHWQPRIEAVLSERLDTQVHIGSTSFSYSPTPTLVLSDINLGGDQNVIGQVVVPVTLRNLWNFRRELADVRLEDVDFQPDFAASIPDRLKPNPGGRDIHFASIRINNFSVNFAKRRLGPISGVIKLNPDGTFGDITINDETKRSEVNIKPSGKRFLINATSSSWTLPGKYPALFDAVTARGLADEHGVLFDDIHGVIFGGAFQGQAQLFWDDGWKLDGSLETKAMQSEPLIQLFSSSTRTSGRMAAIALFSFAGSDYDSLFKNQAIRMKFTVSDGKIHNIDLVAPLRSQSGAIQRGGETAFGSLSGEFDLLDGQSSLKSIVMNAGKFSASGNVNIGHDKLSGNLITHLHAGAVDIQSIVNVGGTLDYPEIGATSISKSGDPSTAPRLN